MGWLLLIDRQRISRTSSWWALLRMIVPPPFSSRPEEVFLPSPFYFRRRIDAPSLTATVGCLPSSSLRATTPCSPPGLVPSYPPKLPRDLFLHLPAPPTRSADRRMHCYFQDARPASPLFRVAQYGSSSFAVWSRSRTIDGGISARDDRRGTLGSMPPQLKEEYRT